MCPYALANNEVNCRIDITWWESIPSLIRLPFFFAYVIREANTSADVFARHGINLRVDSLLFPYVPDFVCLCQR